MALVDEHGRIFGRFNLIDAAIAVIVAGLIPLGYAAYVLFKVPLPVITSIEPAAIQQAPEFRVKIHGEHLRPYMRVSFNDMQARAFYFLNDTTAEAVFGDIPLGTFDVVLYDYAQERSRLSKAVTVTAPPLPPAEVLVAGFFTTLDASLAPKITPGLKVPAVAEVIKVGKPLPDVGLVANGAQSLEVPVARTVRLPALIRVHCSISVDSSGVARCTQGPPVNPGFYLMLDVFDRKLPFLVTEVRPVTDPTPIEMRIRLSPDDPAQPLIKAGDVDVSRAQNEFAGGAIVKSHSASEVVLEVPAYATSSGWTYAAQSVRVGGALVFLTNRYQLTGLITSLPSLPSKP